MVFSSQRLTLFACVIAAASGLGVATASCSKPDGCKSDNDCKGSRICMEGKCSDTGVAPASLVPAGGMPSAHAAVAQAGGAVASGAVPAAAAFACPEGMVPIAAATFDMGSDSAYPSAPGEVGFDQARQYGWRPRHRVELSSYCIDKFEVTVKRYKECVDARKCEAPGLERGQENNTWNVRGKENHPINLVSYEQAKKFCESSGFRLPTEAEWEYAARGPDGREYPWGAAPGGGTISCKDSLSNESGGARLAAAFGENSTCFSKVHGTWAVGSALAGASPFQVLDMAGNVMEWVEDAFDVDFYARSPTKDPRNPPKNLRAQTGIVRGGGWSHGGGKPDVAPGWNMKTFWREPQPYYIDGKPVRDAEVGFRCAASPSR